ncbi:hypothetical protein ANCCAN_25849 [Ancylostoma caninum]|uniref:Uncharacterized protein n=1 Tax=Ancylostoma caninum TaxID=29170 RepID=A0A368FBX8_ANCCA|nr:hypothetical protein ANCCAN_25849 [Ancylostoma caninum]
MQFPELWSNTALEEKVGHCGFKGPRKNPLGKACAELSTLRSRPRNSPAVL